MLRFANTNLLQYNKFYKGLFFKSNMGKIGRPRDNHNISLRIWYQTDSKTWGEVDKIQKKLKLRTKHQVLDLMINFYCDSLKNGKKNEK